MHTHPLSCLGQTQRKHMYTANSWWDTEAAPNTEDNRDMVKTWWSRVFGLVWSGTLFVTTLGIVFVLLCFSLYLHLNVKRSRSHCDSSPWKRVFADTTCTGQSGKKVENYSQLLQYQLSNYDGWRAVTDSFTPAITKVLIEKHLIEKSTCEPTYIPSVFNSPPPKAGFSSRKMRCGSRGRLCSRRLQYTALSLSWLLLQKMTSLNVYNATWETRAHPLLIVVILRGATCLACTVWWCHGRQPVCVWWLGLGAWYSTPMQMASQMADIYTTGPWKVTSVETALSPWLVSHHRELSNPHTPISHCTPNIWPLVKFIIWCTEKMCNIVWG